MQPPGPDEGGDGQNNPVYTKPQQGTVEAVIGDVTANPFLFTGLVVLGVLCILTVIIVPSAYCSTAGCGKKNKDKSDEIAPTTMRLMVRLNDADASVAKLLPLLSKYFNTTKLGTSGLEVLQFVDKKILKEVKNLLKDDYKAVVDLVMSDFKSAIAPTINDLYTPNPAPSTPPPPRAPYPPAPPSSPIEVGPDADPDVPANATADGASSTPVPGPAPTPAPAPSSSRRSAQAKYDDNKADPLEYDMWHLKTINAAGAWAVTKGVPEIIVAVLDTGIDIEHPDLKDNIWINKGEIPGNGIDDDRNVDYQWSPEVCGSDADPRPDYPFDTGHGTHVAGLIAAIRGNGIGGSGIAPRVKIMALKVADPNGDMYASNIMVAYDYALKMGAHVVSCSFGPVPVFNPDDEQKAESAMRERLYTQAIKPLNDKGVVVVAASGNEISNLDGLRGVGMSYLPCTLDLPNVICVSATDDTNKLWREEQFNRIIGTNYGRMTVDMGAPGSRVLSTMPLTGPYSSSSGYGLKTGSSMATPLVSGTVALVLSVLGSQSGNYFQGARARSIVLETGDTRPDLAVITSRILNAERAVQTALSFGGTGSFLLVPMPVDVGVKSGALMRTLTESYFRLSPVAVSSLAADVARAPNVTSPALSTLGLTPFALGARPSNSSLRNFKHTGADVLVAVRGQLNLPFRGVYGLRIATTAPHARIAVTVGQRRLNFNATSDAGVTEALLQVDTAPGWYDFEVLVAGFNDTIGFVWSLPTSRTTWGPLPDGWLVSGTMSYPTPLPWMPRDMPKAGNVPASEVLAAVGGWHILWRPMLANVTPVGPWNSVADPAGAIVFSSGFLADLTLTSHFNYSAYVDELNSKTNTALMNDISGGSVNANRADKLALAAAQSGPIYGFATTFIQSTVDGPMSVAFRVTCTQCQLYLDDVMFHETFDANYVPGSATPPVATTRITPCVTLDPVTNPNATGVNRARHHLQIRFATSTNNVSGPGFVVQQAACTNPLPTFQPVRPIMAPAPWYKASAAPNTALNGSINCDLWDYMAVGMSGWLQLGKIPRPEDFPPVVRIRLPHPKANNYPCKSPNFCPTGRNFTFLTDDIIPVNTLPKYLYARCWTWTNRGMRNGLVTVFAAETLPTVVYLGDQQVFRTLGAGDKTPFYMSSRSPNSTYLNGQYRQLLAVEWHGITAYSRLSITEGLARVPADVPSALELDSSFNAPDWNA
ncbi:hypothetical protein PLESTF_000477900 [Pleodorina starrii]|nr:hypothetical protein PLESTF_000477900 [Pleodorina starrii]